MTTSTVEIHTLSARYSRPGFPVSRRDHDLTPDDLVALGHACMVERSEDGAAQVWGILVRAAQGNTRIGKVVEQMYFAPYLGTKLKRSQRRIEKGARRDKIRDPEAQLAELKKEGTRRARIRATVWTELPDYAHAAIGEVISGQAPPPFHDHLDQLRITTKQAPLTVERVEARWAEMEARQGEQDAAAVTLEEFTTRLAELERHLEQREEEFEKREAQFATRSAALDDVQTQAARLATLGEQLTKREAEIEARELALRTPPAG